MTPEATAFFLKDLETLCRRYGVVVAGCGCCDSPRLDPHEWLPEEDLAVRGTRIEIYLDKMNGKRFD